MQIRAFFAGLKSLLDLICQLLATEGVVAGAIEGFHRDKAVYGGRVLNALRGNARKERKAIAIAVEILLRREKAAWIDQAIAARDLLVHPARGMQQLMFTLDLAESDGSLTIRSINTSRIANVDIHAYATETRRRASEFARAFLSLLKPSV